MIATQLQAAETKQTCRPISAQIKRNVASAYHFRGDIPGSGISHLDTNEIFHLFSGMIFSREFHCINEIWRFVPLLLTKTQSTITFANEVNLSFHESCHCRHIYDRRAQTKMYKFTTGITVSCSMNPGFASVWEFHRRWMVTCQIPPSEKRFPLQMQR